MKRIQIPLVILIAVLTIGCSRSENTTVRGSDDSSPNPSVHGSASGVAAADADQALAESLLGYEARALDGSSFRLADHKGKVVLINAWATWCGPCRYEIPELKRLHEAYADDGLVIVGVSVDMAAAAPTVKQFVQINAIHYPIVLDPESRVTDILRTTSIPTSVMLDRNGNVVWRHVGIVSEQRDSRFREALSKAIGS